MPDDNRFPFQNLDAYRLSRSLAARVHAASIRDAELRDQATRAAKSAFLNLCEGLPSDRPAVRLKFFDQADGSLHEAVAAVEVAALCGDVAAGPAREVARLADRLVALLTGLVRWRA